MTPEEKELLKRSIVLAEENNEILRSLQRSMRLSRFMSALYWVFILGSAIGAYYLVQPYIDAITGAYGGASSNISTMLDSIKGITN